MAPFLGPAKPRLQCIQADRFYHVLVESAFTRPPSIDVLAVPGDGDELKPSPLRQGLETLRDFESVHDGQTQVEQHDVRVKRGGSLQSARSIERDVSAVPKGLQGVGQQPCGVRVVVDDQNPKPGYRGGNLSRGHRRRYPRRFCGTCRQRHADAESCPAVLSLAVRVDGAAMRPHQALHNRQAEAKPAVRTVDFLALLCKEVEDARQHVRSDAAPAIDDA